MAFTGGAEPATGGIDLVSPIVGMAATPTGEGYWLVAGDGGVFTFGDAAFHGSAAGLVDEPVEAIVASATGAGYLIVTVAGEIHTFGDAEHPGPAAAPRRGERVVAVLPG